VDVKEFGEVRRLRAGDDMVDDEYPAVRSCRLELVLKNLHALIIVPVMQNEFHDIRVGRRRFAAHILSEDGAAALGAQAGEARLANVFTKAGFSEFRKAKAAPFNLILEAQVQRRVAEAPPNAYFGRAPRLSADCLQRQFECETSFAGESSWWCPARFHVFGFAKAC
jgi:hypothetical protein